ncbi:MAG: UPF0146 family protein [Archaeoglobaceae archaeon]|nr:UPF0146 family protein [Archaeoglobaceae archaeon]MCX8151683.1 UPF0146 family protein [Archaeoglobaceae archaeon]MDW8013039.1 UPF0146 family protein [Archaeoglobaceae archaeon]
MIQLAEYIALRWKKVAEIGIGNYFEVAKKLKEIGIEVLATDVIERKVPNGIKFFVDDVTNPKIEIYRGVELIYSIRPPIELYKPITNLAKRLKVSCIIKPLSGEFPGFLEGKLINYKGLSFYEQTFP